MGFTSDDPDVQDVVERELRLQDPAVRHTRSAAAELLDREFHEFGASGRVWGRDSILDMMADHEAPPPTPDNIAATRLGEDVILLTYRTRRPERTALRSSLWRRRDGGPWRIYFHQGTVQPDAT
ncbi:nuclear transport factor 2 family protein [Pseudonocardia aurantiaca]|uniref:DUF4440 domain-containing protein n=1 Tax=Pseudonocardia aurantiaca TaxID=75290 RepID=A0ABW4FWV5_9PSEU